MSALDRGSYSASKTGTITARRIMVSVDDTVRVNGEETRM